MSSTHRNLKIFLAICLYLVVLSSVLAGTRPGGDFSLTDHNNQKFQLQQLRGNVVLLFFGYTSCPDVCPLELGKIAQVLTVFEEKNDPVKGLFITVDPDRDTPLKLKQYTSFFNKQLQGLTGSREQIDQVVKQYRVNYRISENEKNHIVVDHSSNLYVIDKKGELNTIIPFGMGLNHVMRVVESLLNKKEVAVTPD